ncbi:MAG: hypothetical protein K0Q68_729 [Moraxellaceae bacterium]|jgi:hypothetical protein|nr:hypothetical protein [Moraxellaceae bacterium]
MKARAFGIGIAVLAVFVALGFAFREYRLRQQAAS